MPKNTDSGSSEEMSRKQLMEVIPTMISYSAVLAEDAELKRFFTKNLKKMTDEELLDMYHQLKAEQGALEEQAEALAEPVSELNKELDELVKNTENGLKRNERQINEDIDAAGEDQQALIDKQRAITMKEKQSVDNFLRDNR